MLAPFIITLLVFVCTAAAALFSFKYLSFPGATIGFWVMALMWICFSIHYPINVMVSDLCVAADQFLSGERQSPVTKYLQKCENISSVQKILDIANRAINNSLNDVCTALSEICVYQYPCVGRPITSNVYCNASNCGGKDPSTCNVTNMAAFLQGSMVLDILVGCATADNGDGTYTVDQNNCDTKPANGSCPSPPGPPGGVPVVCGTQRVATQDCATLCTFPVLQNQTAKYGAGIAGVLGLLDLLQNNIFPLLNCTRLTVFIGQLKNILCIKLNDAVFYITLASAFIGALFAFEIVDSILGIKRFDKSNQSHRAYDHEDENLHSANYELTHANTGGPPAPYGGPNTESPSYGGSGSYPPPYPGNSTGSPPSYPNPAPSSSGVLYPNLANHDTAPPSYTPPAPTEIDVPGYPHHNPN